MKTSKQVFANASRIANVILSAVKLGFDIDPNDTVESVMEAAEEFIKVNGTAQRYEREVSRGNNFDFSAHWYDSPDTEVDHEYFVDDEGNLIQLFYLVGETDHNAPDGFFYSRKSGKHEKEV